jgi:beta-lactamase superfamily II metal-dependent hydrolase
VNDRLAVYMLDVGQGDSTLILLPGDPVRAVVFDCADEDVLTKVLGDWKVVVIEAFILSHLDQDHIAGALEFLRSFVGEIRRVYVPSADRDVSNAHDDAKRAKGLLDHVSEHSRDVGPRRRRWELYSNARLPRPLVEGPGWAIKLLAPHHAQHIEREREAAWEDANRYSSILRVEAGESAMLIGGDAPLLSWDELADAERRANVFRIPHHGGALDDGGVPDGWDVARLYREVGADLALISVGTNNAHGHPRRGWVHPMTGGACRLLCTQVTARCHGPIDITRPDGTVIRDADEVASLRDRVVTKHQQWTVPHYRHLTDKRREVRSDSLEVPCAGTVMVVLHLDGRISVFPTSGGGHDSVVDDWDRPMCRP